MSLPLSFSVAYAIRQLTRRRPYREFLIASAPVSPPLEAPSYDSTCILRGRWATHDVYASRMCSAYSVLRPMMYRLNGDISLQRILRGAPQMQYRAYLLKLFYFFAPIHRPDTLRNPHPLFQFLAMGLLSVRLPDSIDAGTSRKIAYIHTILYPYMKCFRFSSLPGPGLRQYPSCNYESLSDWKYCALQSRLSGIPAPPHMENGHADILVRPYLLCRSIDLPPY